MIKKLILTMTLIMAVIAAGCGGPEKPQVSADKAILAWAQVQFLGEADGDTVAATGLKQDEIDKRLEETIKQTAEWLQNSYMLTDENAIELAADYIKALDSSVAIDTKIKEQSDTNPVVELTFTPVDTQAFANQLMQNANWPVLQQAIQEIQGMDQATAMQTISDPNFQAGVMAIVKESMTTIPVKDPVTIDVKCRIGEGSDGKTHWTPEDPTALANFLGQ